MKTNESKKNKVSYPPLWSNLYYHRTQLRKEVKDKSKNYLKGGSEITLVDYGCGSKPYEEIFSPFVSEYIGLDIEDRKKVDKILCDDGTCSLPDRTAEIVLSSMVLEHVPDPNLYLNECYRILKEGGLLFLLTHGHMIYHPVPGDYWRWTHSGLRKEIEEVGLQVDSLTGIINIPATAAQFFLDSIRPKFPEILRGAINLVMQGVIGLLDKDIFGENRDKDACVFFVVAKK